MFNTSEDVEIIEAIPLEKLLENYTASPFIDISCSIPPEDICDITEKLYAGISTEFNYEDRYLRTIIGECIQNIFQHCNGKGQVLFYKNRNNGLLGIFPFNIEKTSAEDYVNTLQKAKIGLDDSSYLLAEDSEKLPCGAFIVMRRAKSVGLVYVGEKPFFFFEYELKP